MDTHRSRAHALEVVGLKPGWSWAGLSYLNTFGYVSIVHCGCFVVVVVSRVLCSLIYRDQLVLTDTL